MNHLHHTALGWSAALIAALAAYSLTGCSGANRTIGSNCDPGVQCGALTDAAFGDVSSPDGNLTDGGAAASVCPSGRGPRMVQLPNADGGSFCIDSTEVTNAQYAAFLADKTKDTSGQPTFCAQNTTFDIPVADYDAIKCLFDPNARATYPVMCVTWCNARTFCVWAGKRLCSMQTEWQAACTSGGPYTYEYAKGPVEGACVDDTFDGGPAPVGSDPSCHSPIPPYSGVYDLIGNVQEWGEPCSGNVCPLSPGRYGWPPVACNPPLGPGSNGLMTVVGDPTAGQGFRCCATL